MNEVVVVLSSYTCARYISEQIRSICGQTFADWTLLVRDDGSTDDTLRVVEELSRGDPRVIVLKDEHGRLGPAASFGCLLEQAVAAGARYVALADQDDVWLARKVGPTAHIAAAAGSRGRC